MPEMEVHYMPRPCKRRRICSMPSNNIFGPINSESAQSSPIIMALDEYEVIRLIDLEGMTQEECALQMDVARTTVQSIYQSARRKLAQSLVHGTELQIVGGEYLVCDGNREECFRKKGRRCRQEEELRRRNGNMKIAVTYENGQVFQHFGHTEYFKVYEVENGQVINSQVVSTGDEGHCALAGLLQSLQIDALICGGMGMGAQQALARAGIRVFGGVRGNADEAVAHILAGTLQYDPDAHCEHHGEGHEHGHGGDCGHHGHGEGHGGSCGHHGHGGGCGHH